MIQELYRLLICSQQDPKIVIYNGDALTYKVVPTYPTLPSFGKLSYFCSTPTLLGALNFGGPVGFNK